jgi:hypothetical protein
MAPTILERGLPICGLRPNHVCEVTPHIISCHSRHGLFFTRWIGHFRAFPDVLEHIIDFAYCLKYYEIDCEKKNFRSFFVEKVMEICEKQLFNPHIEGVQDFSLIHIIFCNKHIQKI